MKIPTRCGWLIGVIVFAGSTMGLINAGQASVSDGAVGLYDQALSQTAENVAYTFTTESNQVTITGVATNASGGIEIPATLGGYPVTAIGRSAFLDRRAITRVTFAAGANVTNIEATAFQGCSSLTLVELPTGLASIPAGLFYGCTSLVSVTIPSGITNIGNLAFGDCRSLPSLAMPAGLTFLGESAFLNCRSLTSLNIPEGITVIPGQLCYECRALTSVGLPAGVTTIGSSAFCNCVNLTAVTLPPSVSSIGDDAFQGCMQLPVVSVNSALSSVGNRSFYDCSMLERAYFNQGVASLGETAFGNCPALGGVYFGGNTPAVGADNGADVFTGIDGMTVYYLGGGSSWGETFCGVRTQEWQPQISSLLSSRDTFEFTVEWAVGQTIQVQACTNLLDPIWTSFSTNTLTSGSVRISDTNGRANDQRYYRVGSASEF